MSGFMSTYQLTPQLYEEMLQLGETKVGVVRHILCTHYGIDMKCRFIVEMDKVIDEKLVNEATLRQVSKQKVADEIIETYFARRPKLVARPIEDIDAEIEIKLWENRNPNAHPRSRKSIYGKMKRHILVKRLQLDGLSQLDGAIARRAEIVGKTREEIERDLLCAHFGIKQVVE